MPHFKIDLTGSNDPFSKVQKEIENARKRLQYIGKGDLAESKPSDSPLTIIINNLLRSSYGGMNVIREILLPEQGATPNQFDPLQAWKRGFSLEEKVHGKDVAKGLGFSDDPLFNLDLFGGRVKISPSPAGIAGFVGEVINPLDLLNWVTFGTGKALTTAGKTGTELLPHAFGDKTAKELTELLGEEAIKGVSATRVDELANQLLTKAKDNQPLIAEKIREGMEAAGTVTKTPLPGATTYKPLVTRLQAPVFGTKIGEVPIPGSGVITRMATSVGNKFAQSGIGDALGRRFSTKFTPRTVPHSVVVRTITGDIVPGDPRWEENVNKIAQGFGMEEGSEVYKKFREDLHAVFEKSRMDEDDFKRNVEFIFKGLSEKERKDIMYHAATGTPLDEIPEKLKLPLKEFINWRESITKMYHGMGIPVRELENYVPFIVVGGRLSKSESEMLKRVFKKPGQTVQKKPVESIGAYISEKVDPHLKDRLIQATTPHEVNKLLGREWLTEDAALAMAMRGTRAVRAEKVVTFLQGMLDKYGLTMGDLQKLKGGVELPRGLNTKELAKQLQEAGVDVDAIAARGSLPEGYGLYRVRTTPSGGVSLEPLRQFDKGKAFALPEEFARAFNEYVDLYFNPVAQNEVLRIYDQVTSGFRTVAYLWNLGHVMRDYLSNIFNAWIGGVRNPGIYMKAGRLYRWFAQEGNPAETFYVPALGKEFTGEELFEKARELGVVDTGQALGETAQSVKAQVGKRKWYDPKKYPETYTRWMINLTRVADNQTRFAMFLDGLEKGMTIPEAAVRTKKYLFDYFDLTPFERQWMRRIIPFYTWMRKNIPLQLEEVLKQPGKYATVGKYQEAASEETDIEKMPDYIEEGMGIKLPGGTYLMPNLPYADLGRLPFDTQSISEFLSNINPIIRYLPEVAMNKEFFSGMPLEWYEGERTHLPVIEGMIERITGEDIPDVIPRRTLGHLINQIPMLRNLDVMVDPENPRSLARFMSFLGFPPTYPEEFVEKAATYEERDRLRAIIRMLIDQGYIVTSVRDIDY